MSQLLVFLNTRLVLESEMSKFLCFLRCFVTFREIVTLYFLLFKFVFFLVHHDVLVSNYKRFDFSIRPW